MDKKEQRLLHRVEKAGVRESLRAGHPISREELLGLKVQIVPLTLRLASASFGIACAIGSYSYFAAGEIGWGIGLAALALLLILFATIGVKKTFSHILEGMDSASSVEILEAAVEGIASLLGALFDGV
jgi:hypothetical protein